jgi:hypothetical protein
MQQTHQWVKQNLNHQDLASVFDAEGGGEIDPVTTVGVKVSTPTLTLTASCSQVMKY